MTLLIVFDDVDNKRFYQFIKSVLDNFSKLLNKKQSREQKKKLLNMIISKITINKLREIDLIKINLIDYLSKEGGVSLNGTTSSFMLTNIRLEKIILNIYI